MQYDTYVVFALGQLRFALPAAGVERVFQAVAITPLPGGPPSVAGAVNVHGQIMPVLSGHRLTHQPAVPLHPSQKLLYLRETLRPCLLLVDEVIGVESIDPASMAEAERLSLSDGAVRGVATMEDGLTIIVDVTRFLAVEEAEQLDRAMATG